MSRRLDEILAEEDVSEYSGISDDDASESEFDDSIVEISDYSQLQSSAASVVNLASPSANIPRIHTSTAFQNTEDDDDVQILTAAEAEAEMAAAARRAVENPNASRKRKRPLVETKAEPTECTICCEDCTIVGRHRLVALKCGHLFGKKCIERWITEKSTCPNCSAIVRRTDICLLFSDHVAVVDNSGLEDLTNKFEEEKQKSTQLEKDVAALKQQLEARMKEATRLNLELAKYKKVFAELRYKAEQQQRAAAIALSDLATSVGVSPTIPAKQTAAQVSQAHTASQEPNGPVEIQLRYLQPAISTSQPHPNDVFTAAIRKYKPIFDVPLLGARVFSISRSCSYLCIGEKLAQGPYGIFMLTSQDPSHRVMIPIHTSDVRDICIHHTEKHVITVAFDGKLAVTSLENNKVALQVELPSGRRQGWSCSFSETDPSAIYCGFQDGTVAKYDVRKLMSGEQGIVKNFWLPERQPVHSIKSFKIPQGPGAEGLAAATFRGLSVWRDVTDVSREDNRPVGNGSFGAIPFSHVPSDRACFSLASNQLHSNQIVVSSRSTPTKHSVYDLRSVGVGRLAPRMEFAGHKAPSVLSRSALWSEVDGTSVVASWSHDIEDVTLWNVATHREVRCPEPSSLSVASAGMPVVDIQHVVAKNSWSSGMALLGTMTARQLCLFRSGG